MKGIIFDMDGIMFDTERLMIDAYDYSGEKTGIGKAGFMAIRTLGMNIERSRIEWEKEYGDAFDFEKSSAATYEFLDNFYARHKVPVKKGLYDLLDYLKGEEYRIAIASSSNSDVVMHHLKDAGIAEYFEQVISGELVEKSKPSPDIYLKACKRLGLEPSECYALEDSKAGLISAYRAGCKVIMVPDLWEGDQEIEDILYAKCKDLEQVKDIIPKVNFKVS